MTYAAEQAAIQTRFYNNYTATQVKYDNIEFTPTPGTAFAEFEIHDGEQHPISVADTILYRNPGIISINIHIPLNTSIQTGMAYADTAAAVFRGQQFSGITCRGAGITRIGEFDQWFIINVSIPFFRDEAF